MYVVNTKSTVVGVLTVFLLTASVVSAQTEDAVRPEPTVRDVAPEVQAMRVETKAEVNAIRADLKAQTVDAQKQMRVDAEAKRTGMQTEVKGMRAGAETDLKAMRDDMQAEVRAMKEDGTLTEDQMKEKRAELQATLEAKRTEVKQILDTKREEARTSIQASREEFKQRVETAREEVKKQIEAKRAELKERLAVVKDEKKRALVEKVDGSLDEINARRTRHFSNLLGQFEEVLGKIVSRADKAEITGKDVSTVRIAIIDSQNLISVARETVATQAGKTYAIFVTTEEALREAVEASRQSLRADLTLVQDVVKSAHESLRTVATTLAQIPQVNDEIGQEGEASSDDAETATTN